MDYFKPTVMIPHEITIARRGYASTMFEVLRDMIKAFESRLKADEETGAVMAYFGHTLQISVRELTYENPYVMVFGGVDTEGRDVVLLQHPTQINLLLVPIKVNERKPHRVGFKIPPAKTKEADEDED